jgi:protein involved in polysaccharide export with SLBB domain
MTLLSFPSRTAFRLLVITAALCAGSAGALAAPGADAADATTSSDGIIRLKSPAARSVPAAPAAAEVTPPAPPPAGEFERFAGQAAGIEGPLRRLGSELIFGDAAGTGNDTLGEVPPEYLVGLGDELVVNIWGAVEADLRLPVDHTGRIVIPRVGPVLVAGVRYGELNELLTKRVGQVFRNFQLSVSLGRLRSMRIYVTGHATRPGAHTVSALSSVMTALVRSGGPTASGSYRHIEVRRRGQVVGKLDLYDLLVRGDRRGDLMLQPEDVVHVGPIGMQAAVVGSVNKTCVVEFLPEERIQDVLVMAGGLTAVADRSRLALERLSDRAERRVRELPMADATKAGLENGDVLRVFSAVGSALPQARQYKRVKVEGEVRNPGDYVLPPDSSLGDAIRAAGGLTAQAYVFGTDFSRESVRQTQQVNYERALRDLETEFARASSTQRTSSGEDAAAQAGKANATARLIDRLRAVKPTGRVVLELEQGADQLPALQIEDGDRITVPAKPTSVGIFGSVYNGGSYLWREGSTLGDLLRQAGGPTRGADEGSTFVIRANGTVVSARQKSRWFGFGHNLDSTPSLPGDTIFVPEEMNKTTFMQEAKDWTQILYQLGLGAAALKTIKN